jgi:hypothetical protein
MIRALFRGRFKTPPRGVDRVVERSRMVGLGEAGLFGAELRRECEVGKWGSEMRSLAVWFR